MANIQTLQTSNKKYFGINRHTFRVRVVHQLENMRNFEKRMSTVRLLESESVRSMGPSNNSY